jgi:lysozyme
MARRRTSSRTQLRWLGAALLIALIAGVAGWWHLRHWQPDRTAYPVQGVEIGAEDGEVDWRAVKAIGADFAYIDASASAFARDPAFARNLEEARAAKLQVGAVHRYDPCQPAERQAGNFITVVPREAVLLPPAVELDMLAENCPLKVGDAKVESELMTFINEVETHTGKAMILKLSSTFEQRYRLAHAIDRNLWLQRDRYQPDYAGRPWTMWTANSGLENEAGSRALRWIVVQP